MNKKKSNENILWISEIDSSNAPLVGSKAANLGELQKISVPVPDGFVITLDTYFNFLDRGSLKHKIKTALKGLDTGNFTALQEASREIKTHILTAAITDNIKKEIIKAYRDLLGTSSGLVAVRFSASAGDLLESYLNVKGEKEILDSVKKCWASFFSPRAISYRESKNLSHLKEGVAVVVQKMITPQSSGVMFTQDPLHNDKEKIIIEGVFGMGEGLVRGSFTPDSYIVNKKTLEIEEKNIVSQPFQITKEGNLPVSKAWQGKQKLENSYIIELAKWGKKIEDHYDQPQDVEWVFSQENVWIVQARPVSMFTSASPETDQELHNRPQEIIHRAALQNKSNNLLLTGIGTSPGTVSGPVKKIPSAEDLSQLEKGDILVTEKLNPDFVPSMPQLAAVVTNQGGKTSHAAIISREMGIPCVVGTKKATEILEDGQIVTVMGEEGKVYEGGTENSERDAEKAEKESALSASESALSAVTTATKVYINLSSPASAEKYSDRNSDGVGLLRAEFMYAELGQHPRALIDAGKENELKETLAKGISKIASAFKPRPVIYRTSDLKTNEYRNLEGGKDYEEEEANPMLGFRGAARYIADDQVFKIELEAVKKVRQKFNNVWVMLPFVRTAEELKEVKKIMSSVGLHRGGSFKLWLMVETPANIILLEKFIGAGIDGISLGTNDLTQLTLGVDRDNAKVAHLFNEKDGSLLWLLKKAIKEAAAHGISSSICGEAVALYPDLVKKLVKWGISSVSVNPDAVEKTKKTIHDAEKDLVQ